MWRTGTSDATLAASSSPSTQPTWVPSPKGSTAIIGTLRLPGGAGTLSIWQGPSKNGTLFITDVVSLTAAGSSKFSFSRTGEVVGAKFLNGATAQQPEIFVAVT